MVAVRHNQVADLAKGYLAHPKKPVLPMAWHPFTVIPLHFQIPHQLPNMNSSHTHPDLSGRRLEIIRAACHILATSGVSGLTIKHLSQEMNFSEGAIYKHFSSKEDILVTMLSFLAESLDEGLRSAISTENDPETNLRAVFNFMLLFFSGNPCYVTAVFSDGLLETSEGVNACLMRLVKTVSGHIMPIIHAGLQDGSFKQSIPAEDMTHVVMGSIRLLMFKWRLSEFKGDLKAQGGRLINSMLELIKQPK